MLAVWFLHKRLQSLSLQTCKPLHKVAYSLPGTLLAPRLGSSFLLSSLFGGWVGSWGGGEIGEVMWWDFKALCLLRGTVISGGRGEVWRFRPWILVTGCWWSRRASPGTPHSGIYSQRCRSRSWAVHRPAADTQRVGNWHKSTQWVSWYWRTLYLKLIWWYIHFNCSHHLETLIGHYHHIRKYQGETHFSVRAFCINEGLVPQN